MSARHRPPETMALSGVAAALADALRVEPEPSAGPGPIMRASGPASPLKPAAFIERCLAAGISRAQAKEQLARLQRMEWWGNELYSVAVERDVEHGFGAGVRVDHLSIHRRDRAPCQDWRDFQAIKNACCGPETEALELYPANSRVVDTANEYHLWALISRAPDGDARIPVGWQMGLQTEDSLGDSVQRPLAEGGGA